MNHSSYIQSEFNKNTIPLTHANAISQNINIKLIGVVDLDYEKAIETYEEYRLHNVYTTNAVIVNRIVECYLSNKQFDKAETALKELLKSFPFDPTTYYHLALIYQEQGKLTDAQASLKIANEIWENADEAYFLAQKAKSLYNQLEVNL